MTKYDRVRAAVVRLEGLTDLELLALRYGMQTTYQNAVTVTRNEECKDTITAVATILRGREEH